MSILASTLGQGLLCRHNDFFIALRSSLEKPLRDWNLRVSWCPDKSPLSRILLMALAPNRTALSDPNYTDGKIIL